MAVRLTLIDGLNLVRRVFAGVPGDAQTPEHTEDALASLNRSLTRLVDQVSPTHALAVFDAPPPTWRHHLHPGYKATRPPMPSALSNALDAFEAEFTKQGIALKRIEAFEADDVIATIAVKGRDAGAEIVVVSTDKSLLSLIAPTVHVWHHFEAIYKTRRDVERRYGVSPEELLDYLSLVGDRGLGIPGVAGIGPKAAVQLLERFGSLCAALETEGEPPDRLLRLLHENRDNALLSRELTHLKTDIDVGINLRDLRLERGT